MSEPVERAFDYLWNADPNTGRVRISRFDEDHEPIGPALRKDLIKAELAYQWNGMLIADLPPRRHDTAHKGER